jgi:hypothetical protein
VVLLLPLLYVGYLFTIIDGIRRAPLLPTFDGPEGRGTNVLLLASEKDDSLLRVDADTLLVQLIHISEDRRTAAVIHFPRDLALENAAGKRRTLVSAHRRDGAAGIAQALQERLGLRIDHVAQVDFQAYVEATDQLDGVDLTDDTAGRLSGAEALDWVSSDEPEIVLGRRVQDWERSLLREGLRPGVVLNPVSLVGLLRSMADHTALDETFTNRAVRSLAWQSRRLTPDQVIFFTAPVADLPKAASSSPGTRIRPDDAALTRLAEVLAVDNTSGIASFDN